jgi:hypothetical protein
VQATISLTGNVLTIDPVFNLGSNTGYTVTVGQRQLIPPATSWLLTPSAS